MDHRMLQDCPESTSNSMISAVANTATHGCPEGLEEYPNPVYDLLEGFSEGRQCSGWACTTRHTYAGQCACGSYLSQLARLYRLCI